MRNLGPAQEKGFNAALINLNKKLLARSKETLNEEKPGSGDAVAAVDAAEAAKRKAEKEAHEKKLKTVEAEMKTLQKELEGLTPAVTMALVQGRRELNEAMIEFTKKEFSPENTEFLNATRPPFYSQDNAVETNVPPEKNRVTIAKMKEVVYRKYVATTAAGR